MALSMERIGIRTVRSIIDIHGIQGIKQNEDAVSRHHMAAQDINYDIELGDNMNNRTITNNRDNVTQLLFCPWL